MVSETALKVSSLRQLIAEGEDLRRQIRMDVRKLNDYSTALGTASSQLSAELKRVVADIPSAEHDANAEIVIQQMRDAFANGDAYLDISQRLVDHAPELRAVYGSTGVMIGYIHPGTRLPVISVDIESTLWLKLPISRRDIKVALYLSGWTDGEQAYPASHEGWRGRAYRFLRHISPVEGLNNGAA